MDTKTCLHCGGSFNYRGNKKYCKPGCRTAAWKRRNGQEVKNLYVGDNYTINDEGFIMDIDSKPVLGKKSKREDIQIGGQELTQAALNVGISKIVDGIQNAFVPEQNKPATKGDIAELKQLILTNRSLTKSQLYTKGILHIVHGVRNLNGQRQTSSDLEQEFFKWLNILLISNETYFVELGRTLSKKVAEKSKLRSNKQELPASLSKYKQ